MSTARGKLHKQQQLTAHAHRMRIAPSEPERVLWQALRSSQLGTRFRRQVVLRGIIVDFLRSGRGAGRRSGRRTSHAPARC